MWTCASCKGENPNSVNDCQSCGIVRSKATGAAGRLEPTAKKRVYRESDFDEMPTIAVALNIATGVVVIGGIIATFASFFVFSGGMKFAGALISLVSAGVWATALSGISMSAYNSSVARAMVAHMLRQTQNED